MPDTPVTRRAARGKGTASNGNNDGEGGPRKRGRAQAAAEEGSQRALGTARSSVGEVGGAAAGAAGNAAGQATETAQRASTGAGGGSVREELTTIVREAALEVLTPVARRATLQAAKYAITRGPRYASENLAPRMRDAVQDVQDSGGLGVAARRAASVLPDRGREAIERTGLASRGDASSKRRLPLQMSIDIAAPEDVTFEEIEDRLSEMKAFTQGEIVDEDRGARLDGEGEGDSPATAVITVHRLDDDLTRVMVSYDMGGGGGLRGALTGGGLLVARGLRHDLRRLKADLELGVEEESPDEERSEDEDADPRGQERGRANPERDEDDDRDDEQNAAADEEPSPTRRPPARRRTPARARQTTRR